MEAKCCQINDNNIDYNNFWLPGELSNASTDSLCTAQKTITFQKAITNFHTHINLYSPGR